MVLDNGEDENRESVRPKLSVRMWSDCSYAGCVTFQSGKRLLAWFVYCVELDLLSILSLDLPWCDNISWLCDGCLMSWIELVEY